MMAMRVGIYARVSTQDKDQNSETQLLPLREFARVQGWDVQGEFVDHASATDDRRRVSWKRLLSEAATKEILCNGGKEARWEPIMNLFSSAAVRIDFIDKTPV